MHVNILKGRKVRLPKETVYEGMADGRIGIALARVKESVPHYHNRTTEWYLVTKGTGIATINGKRMRLKPYDVIRIKPKTVHNAKTNRELELWVISMPPWSKNDHHLV